MNRWAWIYIVFMQGRLHGISPRKNVLNLNIFKLPFATHTSPLALMFLCHSQVLIGLLHLTNGFTKTTLL